MGRLVKWIVSTLALVLLVGLAVAIVVQKSEPSYHGKPLTEWVVQWQTNRWSLNSAATTHTAAEEAQYAVRAIGTNALPFLLDLMRTEYSPLRERFREFVPRPWHASLGLRNTHYDRILLGSYGIAALGEMAAPAVPDLMELVNAPLSETRGSAIWALGMIGPPAEPAIPLLIQAMTNDNQTTRFDVIETLALIGRQPAIVVPRLANELQRLKSQNRQVEFCEVAHALARFGTNAAATIPALSAFSNDGDPIIRTCVRNALRSIIPHLSAPNQTAPAPYKSTFAPQTR